MNLPLRRPALLVMLSSLCSLYGFAQNPADTLQLKSYTPMDEVVVTGQFQPQSLRQSLYKVRIINGEKIRQRGAIDVLTALNTETGIRFSTDNTLGETDIQLMGMSGQNVKILLDGVPLLDRGSTRQSLSQIDINTIERIEIVEGPMSVVYGTDALAGVINLITKKNRAGAKSFSVTGRLQEESTGNYYSPFSADGVHQENMGLNWSDQKWQASGSFTRNNFGGWTGNAAYRAQESKPKDQYMAGGSIGFNGSKTQTWYRLDYLNEDIYVAGALNPNNYRAKDQHYYTNRFTQQLQNEWRVNDLLRISSALSYQHYERQTETYTLDYTNGSKTPSADAGEQDLSTFHTAFFRSTVQWVISNRYSLQPGFEIKNDRTTGQRISGQPSITDYSAFASAEIRLVDRLAIRPGLRFSKNSIYGAPPVIPSLNARFDIDAKTALRLSYARGFRAPILRELYFYYFDANHSIQGNPGLKAETSNSFQTSVTRKWMEKKDLWWNGSLSAFYNAFNNRIALAAGAGNIFTYFNIDHFKTTGFTLDNNLRYKNLSASLGFSYIGRYNLYAGNAQFSGADLPQFNWSPEVNSSLVWGFQKLKGSAALFYKYTGPVPSYATAVNTSTGKTDIFPTRVASYHWADLTLSKQLLRYLVLQGGIRNIFDVVRISNTAESGAAHSTGGPILTGYGRSYFVGLSFQWNHQPSNNSIK